MMLPNETIPQRTINTLSLAAPGRDALALIAIRDAAMGAIYLLESMKVAQAVPLGPAIAKGGVAGPF
jgi:hypothetical protein